MLAAPLSSFPLIFSQLVHLHMILQAKVATPFLSAASLEQAESNPCRFNRRSSLAESTAYGIVEAAVSDCVGLEFAATSTQ